MNEEIVDNFNRIDDYLRCFYGNEKNDLNDAIGFLSGIIISKRQLEKIKDIESLLKLLKRQGSYNCHEFLAIRIFKKVIDKKDFNEIVEKQRKLLESSSSPDLQNIYASKRTTATVDSSSKLPKEIYVDLAENLTYSEFLSFARIIKLSESEIREIEQQNSNLKTKILFMMLTKFEQFHNLDQLLIKILSLIDREDLSTKLMNKI